MNKSGSLCPAVKAADIVGDKWTLLILRELFLGSTRYSDFERAIPRISPSVLSSRLKDMEAASLIVKRKPQGAKTAEYRLTRAGKELAPIVDQLSHWGMRWAKRQLEEEDVDVAAFMWDFHRTLKTDELPDGATVFSIQVTDQNRMDKWWIIATEGEVDLCTDDPGHDVHLYITAGLGNLASVWLGHIALKKMLESGDIVLSGEPDLERSAHRWFPQSPYAGIESEPSD